MATTYTEYLQIPKHDPTDPFNISLVNEGFDKTEAGILTAYRGRAAYNLLDNSEFEIAQAGYGGKHGTVIYAADRWPQNDSTARTYSKVTHNGHGALQCTSATRIQQKFIVVSGDDYTASVIINGTLYILNFNADGAGHQHSSGQLSLNYINANTYMFVLPNLAANAVVSEPVVYRGTYTEANLPAHLPKGYAAELLECQRYYRNYGMTQFPATITSAGWASVGIDYTGMRVTPTVQYELAGLYVENSRITSVSQITARALPASELLVDTGASITAFQVATIRFNSLALCSDM